MPTEKDWVSMLGNQEQAQQSARDWSSEMEAKSRDAGEVFGQERIEYRPIDDVGLMYQLGGADTLEERANKFKEIYPRGSLERVPGYGDIVYRRDESEPYAYLDPGFTGLAAEYLGQDKGALVAETATQAIPQVRAARIVGRSIATGISSFFGDVAQEGLEEAAGENLESREDVLKRSATKGAFAAGGNLVLSPLFESTANVVRGSGVVGVSEAGREAAQAAERLGLDYKLSPAQMTDNPMVQLIERQAAAVVPDFRRYYQAGESELTQAMQRRVDTSARSDLRDSLERSLIRMEDTVLDRIKYTDVSNREAGIALQQGFDVYKQRSREIVDQAYAMAREMGEPEFDLAPLKEGLESAARGIRAPTEEGGLMNVAELSPALKAEVYKLQRLPQILAQREGADAPERILKEIRSKLHDLKTPDAGRTSLTTENRVAGELYRTVSDILDNPLNGDEAFRAAWSEASDLARQRFNTLERSVIVKLAKTDEPAKLARSLMQPGEVDNLILLRDTLTDPQVGSKFSWLDFRDAYKTELLNDPYNLTNNLARFDRDTLDVVMTSQEQAVMRDVGKQFDRLKQSGIQQALDTQSKNDALIAQLIDRKDTAGVQSIRNIISDDPAAKESVRASVLQHAVKKSIGLGEDGAIVGAVPVEQVVKSLKESGAIKFLTVGDTQFLRDIHLVAQRFAKTADAGTSIQAAETASGLRQLFTANPDPKALVHYLENVGAAKFYLSDAGRTFLVGGGRSKVSSPAIRAFASGIGLVADDAGAPDLNADEYRQSRPPETRYGVY